MENKDKSKKKASKTHQSKKHPKCSNINPPFVQPSSTSHDAPPLETSHAAPPLNNNTLHVSPSSTSRVAPSKTFNVAPSFRNVQPSRTSHDAPPLETPHTAPPLNNNTPHVAPSSTSFAAPSKTFNGALPFRNSHVAPSRISKVARPYVTPLTTSDTIPLPSTSHGTTPPSTRGVVSPSNSQPSHNEAAHIQESNEAVAAPETQSNGGKRILYLDGQGFLPSHPAASGIGDIMKSNFSAAWLSWKKIPITTRDLWFIEFKKKFVFCPPDDAWARKNFEIRGAAVMKNNLHKARIKKHKPEWIDMTFWNTLCDEWGTQKFKKKSIQGKTNKASDCGGFAVSLHTCGSITTSQHRAYMTEQNGTPPNPSELFIHTHKHRKNGTWVDRRSEHVHEKYKLRSEQLTQEASLQGNSPPKDLDVWCEVAGIRKGRVYGLGMESTVIAGRPYYRGSCSSSTEWVQRHEFEEMRNERDQQKQEFEEMRKERDQLLEKLANTDREVRYNSQMIKQLMESYNIQAKSYARDHDDEASYSNHDDDASDNDEGTGYNNEEDDDGDHDEELHGE